MTVLALDTSTDMLVCAIGSVVLAPGADRADVEMIGDLDHLCRRQANVELVGAIGDLLEQSGLTRRDIDAVLVSRGPGSFTGVRIGVAAGKGVACGSDVPLLGASTLDAMAWNAWNSGVRGTIGVVGDAMRSEVYPGLYEADEAGVRRLFSAETVMKAGQAADEWAQALEPDGVTLTGDGLKKHRAVFERAGFAAYADETAWYPSGEGLLRTAFGPSGAAFESSGDPALVLPIYTRLSDAEENERKRLGMGQTAEMLVSGVDDLLGDAHRQFRPMGVNDLDQVAELEAAAYPAGEGHDPWTRQMFGDEYEQPDRTWWIVHDQGRVIAFAGGLVAGGNLEVLDVVVDPSARREGLATRLLGRLSYDAQMLGASTASLEVDCRNDAAQSLYRALGFERAGLRRDYYGKGFDALTMCAELPLGGAADSDGGSCGRSERRRVWPTPRAGRPEGQIAALQQAGPLILAIESSCDETAMAVIDGNGAIRANVVATQIDFHARFGGVVPEIASRKHIEAIVGVFEETMSAAASDLGVDYLEASDLAAVACTQGPGLVGALVVGLSFAKALAWSTQKPLVCVNHLEGHLFANLFQTPDLTPPFVASLLSGGHTMLVLVRDWGDYEVLGETLDDAVGEAFDKVSKALGLGYPGGPVISRLAARGNPRAIDFPRAMLHSHDYRFSLSGLKTAVVTYIQQREAAGRAVDV